MRRAMYAELLRWKDDPQRSVLLLEGVRQCGKTYLLKQFGEEQFSNTVYINFEKESDAHALFSGNLDPGELIRKISLYKNASIEPGRTLIFLDEIQACGRAMTSLKYFTEEAQDYYVVCAGSLIGLILNEESFPVGKVDRMRLYPMTFMEFLMAEGQDVFCRHLMDKDPSEPMTGALHAKALGYLRDYYNVGGMPKAVMSWVTHHDITRVTRIHRSLLKDYRDDFVKHGSEIIDELLAIWDAIPNQLMKENRRMKLKDVLPRGRAEVFTAPLQWLTNAGLIHCVYHVDSPFVPLSAVKDPSMFKVYLCDVGLLRTMAGVPPSFVLSKTAEFKLAKGAMAENFAVCAIAASGYDDDICYWKDERNEVDVLVSTGSGVVPIEVKYGLQETSDSMKKYMAKYDPERSVFLSANDAVPGKMERIPIYCAEMLLPYLNRDSYSPLGTPQEP